MGFNMKSASRAAKTLNIIATRKTAPQPWALAMKAATGTSNEPAPLAVYSMPLLAAAYFDPNVSPLSGGKISPYTPNYGAVTGTKRCANAGRTNRFNNVEDNKPPSTAIAMGPSIS
jgi:hypothetical protein